jgi:hypothetical protein
MSESAIQNRAGLLLALRPELQGHLGAGFAPSGLAAVARGQYLPGGMMPLAVARPAERLDRLKQEVARRDPPVPEGTADLRSPRKGRAAGMPDQLRALLDAPFCHGGDCSPIGAGRPGDTPATHSPANGGSDLVRFSSPGRNRPD